MEEINFKRNAKALEIISKKTALVICGGGTNAVALVSSIGRLIDLGLSLDKLQSITGSSVGAIIATIIACRGSYLFIKKKMDSLNYHEFASRDCFLKQGVRLLNKYGVHKTNRIDEVITEVMLELLGNAEFTFKDLYELTGRHLTITYLSLNYGRTIYADYINEPDTLIREAVVKSCSIPVFYEAFFENKNGLNFVSADGGVENNYPMNVPRAQKIDPIHILGLKLIAPKDMTDVDNGGNDPLIDNGPPIGMIDYLTRIIGILRDQAMRTHVSKNDWMLTVKINVGNYSSTNFDLSEDDKMKLAGMGREAVNSYVDELASILENETFFP
jgi:NTE family protein